MNANELYAQTMMNFQACLEALRDFPEADKVNMIARIANADPSNIALCQDFAYICISKLTNVNTPPTYKKPILYAMDAVLKKVPGGPYPIIFAGLFAEHGVAILSNIPNHEKQKIDFLLGTWGERNYFTPELLHSLREILRQTVRPQPVQLLPSSMMTPQSLPQQPRGMQQSQSRVIQPKHQQQSSMMGEDATYQFAVHNEMISLLNKLYSSMNITNPLSLEQIEIQDPNLFEQLRQTARENVSSLLNSRNTASSSNAEMQMSSRKRTAQDQPPNPRNRRGGRSNTERGAPAPPSLVIPSDTHSSIQQSSSSAHNNSSHVTNNPAIVHQPSGQLVKGYVCEKEVFIDVNRAKYLTNSITDLYHNDHLNIINPNLKQLFQDMIPRMNSYLANIMTPPPLPRFLNGPLPVEPIFNKAKVPRLPVEGALHQSNGTNAKIPVPVFRIEDLKSKIPETIVRALYVDRPFQYQEDGLRFKTEEQLLQHKEKCVKRAEFLKKNKSGSRQCRQWFCTGDQWITDFDSLTLKKNEEVTNKNSNLEVDGSGVEQFVVPVDEDFPRCPISREPFERMKDDDGEDLYRNAVKVLVTPRTPHVFEKGHPLGHMMDEIDTIRYLIVHKKLVMDNWLREGKSCTLDEVLKHPQCRGFDREILKQAAADEQEDDEIFVML